MSERSFAVLTGDDATEIIVRVDGGKVDELVVDWEALAADLAARWAVEWLNRMNQAGGTDKCPPKTSTMVTISIDEVAHQPTGITVTTSVSAQQDGDCGPATDDRPSEPGDDPGTGGGDPGTRPD